MQLQMKGVILAPRCRPSFGFPCAIPGVFSLYGVRHKAALGLCRILLSQDTFFILLDLLNSDHRPVGSSLQLTCPAHWLVSFTTFTSLLRGAPGGWTIGNALALTPKLSLDQELPANTSRE